MLKILLALSLLSVSAMADLTALAPAPSGSGLDSGLIRKYYLEGDFERAIPILENLLGSEPSINHADSVFVFKHLGVMCAAGGKTRARGKYYMQQLLLIEPTARIMDMYADDMIGMIFRNIQEEYSMNQARLNPAEGHRAGDPASPEGEDPFGLRMD